MTMVCVAGRGVMMGFMLEKMKKLFDRRSCTDCGWWVACDRCSQVFDDVDSQLKSARKSQVQRGGTSAPPSYLSQKVNQQRSVRQS